MSFVLLLPIVGLILSNPIGMKDFNGVLRNGSQCMDEGCIDKFMKKLGKSAYCRRFRDHWYMLSLFPYSLSISMTLTLPLNLCVCTCMCVHTGMHRCACSLAHLWRPANNFRYVLVLTFDIAWDLILCCRQLHAPDWLAWQFLGILMSTPSLSLQNSWGDCHKHFQEHCPGSGDSNPCPHTCVSSVLPTEPPLQIKSLYL